MNQNIEQYLSQLKKELSGSDRATIQDALADTEEHLRTALSTAIQDSPDISEVEALETIIEQYGQPGEVAAAYKEAEALTLPAFSGPGYGKTESIIPDDSAEPRPPDTRPFYRRFFGVVLEPRAWGALFYLFFSLATGIFYFTWVVTGLSLSAGLLVMIIGLPVAALFILSVRGLALVEGRIVEALLGVRMPRRPVYQTRSQGWWNYFKRIVSDKQTWYSMVYMLLQMPLGIFYFTLFVTLIALMVGIFLAPFAGMFYNFPVFVINDTYWYISGWTVPFIYLVGIALGLGTMHLAKALGKIHGSLARALLVRV